MFTIETPGRNPCILTEKFNKIFPNYTPRIQDRTLRFYDDNNAEYPAHDEVEEYLGPQKKQKIFLKNGVVNNLGQEMLKNYHIYKSNGIAFACTLTKTDPQLNQNKFYKLSILKHDNSDEVWLLTEWGRTGTNIGSYSSKKQDSIDQAIDNFRKIFEKWTGNCWSNRPYFAVEGKYVYLDQGYDSVESPDILENLSSSCFFDESVEKLMKLIFSKEIVKKTLMEMEIDVDKMPLGMLSQLNLMKAMEVLKKIHLNLCNKMDPNHDDFVRYSRKFYHLIPEKSLPIINNIDELLKKYNLLDDLQKIEVAFEMSNNQDPIMENYHRLDTIISPVDADSDDFHIINEYSINTFATFSDYHSRNIFTIENVFKIESSIDERFKQHENCSNRKLLWHGSKIANFPNILKNGLTISPPSDVFITGKMFGHGVYFTDIVSKATLYVDRAENDQYALLLLSEVALGEELIVTEALGPRFVREHLPDGKNSIKAVGKTYPCDVMTNEDGLKIPLGYLETDDDVEAAVDFNEYIVFDESRIKMKYLVRIRFIGNE